MALTVIKGLKSVPLTLELCRFLVFEPDVRNQFYCVDGLSKEYLI